MQKFSICVFDVDGTLLDSDEALVRPFVRLGVERQKITFGHVLADECARLNVSVAEYLSHYEVGLARPYDGVTAMLDGLDRWAVCSNKDGPVGRAELEHWGWRPVVACFADDFDGPKRLDPVLEALALPGSDILFVGDTAHDRQCALASGAGFALAGWNGRAVAVDSDIVLEQPSDILNLLR